MGLSDAMIIPQYKSYFSQLIKVGFLPTKNVKVAWLGQQNPYERPLGNISMHSALQDFFDKSCSHDFYDIENEKPWDAHGDWGKIEGYDIVLAIRINYLVPSVKHLLSETKKVIDNNNCLYITDFCSGNITKENNIIWNENSNNMIAYLPEYWPKHPKLVPSAKEDCILTKEKIEDAGLFLNRFSSFVCPKNRFNTICTLEKL